MTSKTKLLALTLCAASVRAAPVSDLRAQLVARAHALTKRSDGPPVMFPIIGVIVAIFWIAVIVTIIVRCVRRADLQTRMRSSHAPPPVGSYAYPPASNYSYPAPHPPPHAHLGSHHGNMALASNASNPIHNPPAYQPNSVVTTY